MSTTSRKAERTRRGLRGFRRNFQAPLGGPSGLYLGWWVPLRLQPSEVQAGRSVSGHSLPPITPPPRPPAWLRLRARAGCFSHTAWLFPVAAASDLARGSTRR